MTACISSFLCHYNVTLPVIGIRLFVSINFQKDLGHVYDERSY